jgi:galactokinase
VICLVKAAEADAFADHVKGEYKKQVNISPQIFAYEPQDGAREVDAVISIPTP